MDSSIPIPARISDVIANDLRQKIDSGQDLPCPITISALGEYYEVSQSPIRTAVELLIEWQFLIKLDNGRLEINLDKKGRHAEVNQGMVSPADLQKKRDQVYDRIVQHVLLRSLSGEEDFMREEASAEAFDVGRAHVRQIFSELSGLGLLEHIPRRGWRILPFDLKDMCQFLEIREVLECKALMLAKERLDPARLQEMLDGNPEPPMGGNTEQEKATLEEFLKSELNNEIHGYLISVAGNRYISDFFQRNGLYFFRLFDLAAFDVSARVEMTLQHRKILIALLQKNWSAATEALAEHIRSQKPVVAELLNRLKQKRDPRIV